MTKPLGGAVTFESEEGKGATFMVRLLQKKLNIKRTGFQKFIAL
jgi:hypothetical protein